MYSEWPAVDTRKHPKSRRLGVAQVIAVEPRLLVANLVAQRSGGRPREDNDARDGREARLKWIDTSLGGLASAVGEMTGKKVRVILPALMGCAA